MLGGTEGREDRELSKAERGISEISSSQAEMNEDLRLIKDFKTFISEKKTPRVILVLRNSILLLSLVLIALMSNHLQWLLRKLIFSRL